MTSLPRMPRSDRQNTGAARRSDSRGGAPRPSRHSRPSPLVLRLRRTLPALAALGLALALAGAADAPRAAARPLDAPPPTPQWPAGDLPTKVRDTLVGFFDFDHQAQDPRSLPYYLRAPEWEIDKAPSLKDPDLLWEYFGGPGTACHPATTPDERLTCAGKRLARTFGLPYYGGGTLFDVANGYYLNEAVAHMAGYYALYHAFVGDFDAPQAGGYVPSEDPDARDHQIYHRQMAGAYERHQRDIIVRMFRDTRTEPQFQADLTRSAGGLALGYARTLQVVERRNDWLASDHRRDAIALLNALVQRSYWEWMAPQPEGPITAGYADLGSEATYTAAVTQDISWAGTHEFIFGGETIRSLRPADLDTAGWDGLWFDADYALPGEWWCHGRFSAGSPGHTACMGHARREARDGTKSPFGQYYAEDPLCTVRASGVTPYTCGPTNLGSIAEEWMWTHVGARAGSAILKALEEHGDPDLPAGSMGARVYDRVTTRLGYGVSGWHGGEPYDDDMEWKREGFDDQPVRTLSAGRHDNETQNGEYSLGETATFEDLVGVDGDTWAEDRQEFPGSMENHLPGPNALYGTLILGYVLSDKVAEGLSPSLYDNFHRNNVDEFNAWLMVTLSSYFRCQAVGETGDPADPRCIAFETGKWPDPPSVDRVPLYAAPDDAGADLSFRYLWREPNPGPDPAIDPDFIAPATSACREGAGIPWRSLWDMDSAGPAPYLTDEGGFGAYNEILQGYGGMMRLFAARHPLDPLVADPAEQAAYDEQREDVLEPWYDLAYTQVDQILDLFAGGAADTWGYVPQIENSTCIGTDPRPGSADRVVLAWQYGTADSVASASIRRAMWYSLTPLWYWWYSDWVDIDGGEW